MSRLRYRVAARCLGWGQSVADDLPEMFTAEWEAQRSDFYRAFSGDDVTPDNDDPILQFALSLNGLPQHSPEPLRVAGKALLQRVIAANSLLSDWKGEDGFQQRELIAEVLSDCAVMLARWNELLSPYGNPDDVKASLVGRRRGRRKLTEGIEFRHKIAAESLAEIDKGMQPTSADSLVAERRGLSQETVGDYRLERERIMSMMSQWSLSGV